MKMNALRVFTLILFCFACISGPVMAQESVPAGDSASWFDQLIGLVLAGFTALPAPVQVGSMVLAMILTLVPHIAPFTPWTWDDKTIQYKAPLTRFFLKLWNVAAGNWGRSSNKTQDW